MGLLNLASLDEAGDEGAHVEETHLLSCAGIPGPEAGFQALVLGNQRTSTDLQVLCVLLRSCLHLASLVLCTLEQRHIGLHIQTSQIHEAQGSHQDRNA